MLPSSRRRYGPLFKPYDYLVLRHVVMEGASNSQFGPFHGAQVREFEAVLQAIDPAKDVDGFHPVNVGGLATGDPAAFAPCTPGGCLIMLREQFDGNLSGRRSLRERRTISSLRRSTALRFMAEACSMYLITR